VRSGRLDRRLTLQRRTLIENDYGEPVETWTDLATVWAEKIPVRGAERYAAMQTVAEVEERFKIRYRKGLTPLDRVVCAGTTYDVKGVLEIGRREGWEILAKGRAE
jgi:SPP1 family predicted phage head-tail adaptor